jgi:hypothetical protein
MPVSRLQSHIGLMFQEHVTVKGNDYFKGIIEAGYDGPDL